MRPDAPFLHLPALIGLALLASAAPARQVTMIAALCGGGSAPIPGKAPMRDCDQACHVGCQGRQKRRG